MKIVTKHILMLILLVTAGPATLHAKGGRDYTEFIIEGTASNVRNRGNETSVSFDFTGSLIANVCTSKNCQEVRWSNLKSIRIKASQATTELHGAPFFATGDLRPTLFRVLTKCAKKSAVFKADFSGSSMQLNFTGGTIVSVEGVITHMDDPQHKTLVCDG